MNYNTIAENIIKLKNGDLELRDRLIQNGQLGDEYNEEMMKLHNRNAEVLNEIIDKIGFPTINKVGAEASEAAWLVIQHSIGKPVFMKKCQKLLGIATAENKADPKQLAYLTDRIATFEGRQQEYGTQFDWDENGELSPYPFDDISKVNQRRMSVGLNTLEEQIEAIRSRTKQENQSPPMDFEKRMQDFEEWKRKVGWIK